MATKKITIEVSIAQLGDSYVMTALGEIGVRGVKASTELTALKNLLYKLYHDQDDAELGLELVLAGETLTGIEDVAATDAPALAATGQQ